jgi:hypothetical protein
MKDLRTRQEEALKRRLNDYSAWRLGLHPALSERDLTFEEKKALVKRKTEVCASDIRNLCLKLKIDPAVHLEDADD